MVKLIVKFSIGVVCSALCAAGVLFGFNAVRQDDPLPEITTASTTEYIPTPSDTTAVKESAHTEKRDDDPDVSSAADAGNEPVTQTTPPADEPVTDITTEPVTEPVITTDATTTVPDTAKPVTTTTKPVTTKPVTTTVVTTEEPDVTSPDGGDDANTGGIEVDTGKDAYGSGGSDTHIIDGSSMTLAEYFAEIAYNEVGVKETGNNNVKYNTWYYGHVVNGKTSNQYSWCVVFVVWCANQAGIDTAYVPKIGGAESMRSFFVKNGNYTKRSSADPSVGDIIFFGSSTATHAGIVYKVEGDTVYTVEGNASNRVRFNQYSISSSKILGYGTPGCFKD